MIDATEALHRLREGNRRFVAGEPTDESLPSQAQREALAEGQAPFAIVLGCSDSRVPAEMVFSQGLGDLFVVRVAGNVAAPSQIGSIEFAAAQFGTPLVVVLGHSRCGAVKATLDELVRPSEDSSPNLSSIVGLIRPGVETLLESPGAQHPEVLLQMAVRANVHASVDQLKSGSQVLTSLIDGEKLRVVGAEYSLDTGAVEFLGD